MPPGCLRAAFLRLHFRNQVQDLGEQSSNPLKALSSVRIPVSLVAPPVAILAAAALAGVTLDARAFALNGQWPDLLSVPARALTDLGKSGWILTGSAIVMAGGLTVMARALTKSMQERARAAAMSAAFIFSTVALSGTTANLLKRIIGRPRPHQSLEDGAFGLSPISGARFEGFPSGHATTLGAFAACLAILFPKYRLPILFVAALLAITRVIVGAHYPSDIVAGFGYGIWWAWLAAHFFKSRGFAFKP